MINQVEPDRFLLHLRPVIKLTDDQLFELCQINQPLWIERTAEGDLVIMAPEGWETGIRGANSRDVVNTVDLAGWYGCYQRLISGLFFAQWCHACSRCRMGAALTSSSPLSPEQKQKFLPLCPDFVVEIRSPSDRLSTVQAKMQEYLDNGARLGWLIDAANRAIYVYRPNQSVRGAFGQPHQQFQGKPSCQDLSLICKPFGSRPCRRGPRTLC